MRKKAFLISQVLVLAASIALILSGCGSSNTTTNLASSQKLVFPNVGTQDVRGLDPALAEDQNSIWALNLIDAGLVTLDGKSLKVVPDLASSWDISADGKTYTFHIRPNLKFSNGDPLTAQDFAYSINRAFAPAQSGQSYTPTYYLGLIVGGNDRAAGKIPTMIGPGKGLVVVDDHTLQINITQPALWFLDALTYIVSAPVDQKVVEADKNWAQDNNVGTGPFMLKSWQHKVQLTFVRNPNWYGTKPTLTEVDMPMIADPDTAWKEFQSRGGPGRRACGGLHDCQSAGVQRVLRRPCALDWLCGAEQPGGSIQQCDGAPGVCRSDRPQHDCQQRAAGNSTPLRSHRARGHAGV